MAVTETVEQAFGEWAVVDLFGHTRWAGWLTEQELAGAGFLRLEIPADTGPVTKLLNPKAVYGITPVAEDVARAVAAHCQPAPVHRWELPAATPRTVDVVDEDDTHESGEEPPF